MKFDDQLLRQLRDSLAAFAASKMTLRRVDARDFRLVDLAFYDRVAARLSACGFKPAGDFVPVTGHPSDGSMRCFLRAFLSSDGSCAAACYHPRPKFLIGLIAPVVLGRLGKVVEVETEFSDDTWIITTTAPRTRLLNPPPLLLRDHYPESTEIERLLVFHKRRVRAYLETHPEAAIRPVSDVAGLERSQARQHDIKAVYRTMIGGLSADEIRRFSILGQARSAALKARLDAISKND